MNITHPCVHIYTKKKSIIIINIFNIDIMPYWNNNLPDNTDYNYNILVELYDPCECLEIVDLSDFTYINAAHGRTLSTTLHSRPEIEACILDAWAFFRNTAHKCNKH